MSEKCETAIMLDCVINEARIRKAQCGFSAIPGQTYHVYSRSDASVFISMVAPQEWDTAKRCLTYICDVVQHQEGEWKQA
jgi:hypothetical protein